MTGSVITGRSLFFLSNPSRLMINLKEDETSECVNSRGNVNRINRSLEDVDRTFLRYLDALSSFYFVVITSIYA